jgi:hypothetical protein
MGLFEHIGTPIKENSHESNRHSHQHR